MWARLHEIRQEVLGHFISIADAQRYDEACLGAGLSEVAEEERCYALLTHLAAQTGSLASAGLSPRDADGDDRALPTMQRIEREIYLRSVAHYERNYRTVL